MSQGSGSEAVQGKVQLEQVPATLKCWGYLEEVLVLEVLGDLVICLRVETGQVLVVLH